MNPHFHTCYGHGVKDLALMENCLACAFDAGRKEAHDAYHPWEAKINKAWETIKKEVKSIPWRVCGKQTVVSLFFILDGILASHQTKWHSAWFGLLSYWVGIVFMIIWFQEKKKNGTTRSPN